MGVLRILLVFAITIMMAMFVVLERNKIIKIGYQVAKLQRNCTELSEKNRKLSYYVGKLKSPEIIAYKVQSLKLPLILQEDSSGIMVASQIKLKEDVTKPVKMNLNKDLYTQKEPILGGYSLRY